MSATTTNHALLEEHTTAGEPMSAPERVALHNSTLERILYLTQLADAKAAPVLALHAGLAGVTIATVDRFEPLMHERAWLVALAIGLMVLYTASAAGASFLTLLIYYPAVRPTRKSLTFFADIRELSPAEFAARSRGTSFEDVEADLLSQVHISSEIIGEKFDQLKWAFTLSGLSLAAWVPLMVWAGLE